MFYVLSIILTILGAAEFAFGQADYRNLDAGRPIAIEDAYPIEFRAFEFEIGIPRFSREEGHNTLSFEPELKWGFAKDWQVGISGENTTLFNDRTMNSFRDTQIHALYNLNQESFMLPAIGFRPEMTFPTGGMGSENVHAALKGIISKSIGLNRIHVNGSYTIGPTENSGRGGELVNRYLYGAAYERTFPIEFLVLLADIYAVKPIDSASTEVIADLGARYQITPVWVLDAGLFTGIRKGPDFGFTVGLSYIFSFRGLFPTEGKKGEL
jgi:hypothetical protein